MADVTSFDVIKHKTAANRTTSHPKIL